MGGTPDGGEGRGRAPRGGGAPRRHALGGVRGGRRAPAPAARAPGPPARRERPCAVAGNSAGRRAPVRRVRRVRAQLPHRRHADRVVRGDGGRHADRGQRGRWSSRRALAARSAAGRSRRSGGPGAGRSGGAHRSGGGGGSRAPRERAARARVRPRTLARTVRAHLSECGMISICVWLLAMALAFAGYTYLGYPLLLGLAGLFRRGRPPVAAPVEWPAISIVLPVYNEEAVVRQTLENLLRLDYPADRRQILVVSDASTDGTDGIVREYAGRGVELLRLSRRGGGEGGGDAAVAPPPRGTIVTPPASRPSPRRAPQPPVPVPATSPVGLAS